MDTNNYFDKIEDYIDGELNEAERIAFEQELEKNERLQKEIAFSRRINTFIETEPEIEQFSQAINESILRVKKKKRQQSFRIMYSFRIAASILLLFSVWSIYSHVNHANKINEDIQKLKTEKNVVGDRGSFHLINCPSDSINYQIGDQLKFSWELQDSVEIKVMLDNLPVVESHWVSDTIYIIPSDSVNRAGLYHWSILYDGNFKTGSFKVYQPVYPTVLIITAIVLFIATVLSFFYIRVNKNKFS